MSVEAESNARLGPSSPNPGGDEPPSAPSNSLKKDNFRSAGKLAVVVLAMFGFGYALVPLYDVLCEITGLGGRSGGVVEAKTSLDAGVDLDRTIEVQFIGTVSSQLPWEFRPNEQSLHVHPGQVYETTFFARNLADEITVGHARPAVSPSEASRHFNKTECFCFTLQEFSPGEGRDMPVRFVLDRGIPDSIETVTLAYTFFNSR
ncbi:cytochrome c oxidase assembly protein [Thioalkalivibrio sp. HK1]|uniref:cytochrome c oxidase assembly protein n=1 Tax=Thioalkalivibrio sp. HK1 TaxID=1469245 RepID=UPI0004723E76|nr:cytochrome c oxidase assembly protein [Thioalkalivibrio sp. HK1]